MTSITIYTILASKPHNPHYLKRYIKFIDDSVKSNESLIEPTVKHHICPKAQDLFPEYKSLKEHTWNLAELTERQHIIAHWMLWKVYKNKSTTRSFWMMRLRNGSKITSKVYAKLREDFKISMCNKKYKCQYCGKTVFIEHFNNCPIVAKKMRIAVRLERIIFKKLAKIAIKEAKIAYKNDVKLSIKTTKEIKIVTRNIIKLQKIKSLKPKTINGGFVQTEESKTAIRETRLKNKIGFGESNGMFSKHHSDKSRQLQSESKIGENHPNFGKHHSEETLIKMRKPKGLQKLIMCPHCNKIGGCSNMKRYHFDNCESK